MDKRAIGKRIKKLRGGISQAELADMLGTKQVRISHIETGRVKPTLELLIAMSKLFKSSIDYILTGKRVPTSRNNTTEKEKS